MEHLQPLIDGGYCTVEEAEAVASKPEPFVPVLSWVASIAQDLCDTHGLLTPMQIHLVGSLLVDFRANAANVLLFVNTQLPYLAVQLFAVIVYAYLLQLLAVSGGVIGSGLETGDYSSVYMGYFTVLLSSYIYFGLLSLYSILANPFGDDACDFPTDAYQARPSPEPPLSSPLLRPGPQPAGSAVHGVCATGGRRWSKPPDFLLPISSSFPHHFPSLRLALSHLPSTRASTTSLGDAWRGAGP